MSSTDAELLDRYRLQDDQTALEALIARHAMWVRRVCLRVVGAPELADDATQAVFILFVRHVSRLKGEGLTGWLQRTACRVASNALRGERRRRHHERIAGHQALHQMHLQDVAMSDEPATVVAGGQLDDWLMQLSARQRDAVIRFYLLGQRQAQIAREANCSVSAVKERLASGLAALRRIADRHGMTVPIVALLALVAPAEAAAAPAIIARCIASGRSGFAGAGRAVRLARGVLRTMWIQRICLTTSVVVGLSVTLGVGALVSAADPPPVGSQIVWDVTLGGADSEHPFDMAATADALYVVGAVDGTFPGQTPIGGNDALVLRLDRQGNLVWAVQFGTEDDEAAFAVAVANDLIYVGVSNGADLVLHAFRPSDGHEVWQRLTNVATGIILQDLIAGPQALYVTGSSGSGDSRKAYVAGHDLAGARLWERRFGEGTLNTSGRVCGAPAPDGDVYVLGCDEVENSQSWLLVTRLDAAGAIVWQRKEDIGHLHDRGVAIASDAAGNCYCVGGSSNHLAVSLNADGDRRWACAWSSQVEGMESGLLSSRRVVMGPDDGEIYVVAGAQQSDYREGYLLSRLQADDGRVAQMEAVPAGTAIPVMHGSWNFGLAVDEAGAVSCLHPVVQPPGDDQNMHDMRLVTFLPPGLVVRTLALRLSGVSALVEAIGTPGPVSPEPAGDTLRFDPLYQAIDYTFSFLLPPLGGG